MSALFPPAAAVGYDGRASRIFLGLLALLTIGPGLIHSFLPDGGAVSIAGLDVGDHKAQVVGLFAWAGATQIVWGLAMLAVALRYVALTPLFLLLVLVERSLLMSRWWLLEAADAPAHHPPAHYTGLILLPLVLLFLILALRRKA